MSNLYDTIIIGAGHNGLVCANYLAKSGRKVLVLEANEGVGGAAITREFAPEYSVSACAHLLHLLNPKIVSDLALNSHGLKMAAKGLTTLSLSTDGEHLTLDRDSVSGKALLQSDKKVYRDFQNKMRRFARILRKTFMTRPPRLVHKNRKDLMTLASLGLSVRLMGRDDMRELLRIGAINIYDVLQEDFQNEHLKAALGFDAVLGSNLGPRSPNSVLSYLYRLSGQVGENDSAVSQPAGGMGSVTEALKKSAEAAGVEIRTGVAVSRILLDVDKVVGVETSTGENLKSAEVVSNADPKTTFFKLVGARNLETGFSRRVDNIRMQGKAAKLHLALDALPEFTGVSSDQLGNRMIIAPSLTYLEQAFDHSKYGEFSNAPALEITIPSVHDQSLVPAGKHVLSAVVQYAPYDLRTGWESQAEVFKQIAIDKIEEYAPGIKDLISASELLTPVDIESEFKIHGGHWHHGEYTLDQFMMLRPVPGAAQYSTPLSGLFLCGAGSHPGGGVMGLAGKNASAEIINGGKN
ncbi:MAG: FAD-dependent oxidoreductase [Gammaproteobacteria bacterium]|nr:FAD-dependent oxidoreductase [Gammaproteobacteria bacterium]